MKKFLVVIFLMTGLLSCNNSDENNKTEGTADQKTEEGMKTLSVENTLKSETGDKAISAVLELGKEEIKKLNPVEMKLTLLDKEGKKLEKASVIMDLTMPDMAMPKNEVKFTEKESGIYAGTAIFTMRGKWRLNTTINVNNTNKELFFEFLIK